MRGAGTAKILPCPADAHGGTLTPRDWEASRGLASRVRQRALETVDRRLPSDDLPGATPGDTGTAGHCTARDALHFAAGDRAHDGTGRGALPHLSALPRLPEP